MGWSLDAGRKAWGKACPKCGPTEWSYIEEIAGTVLRLVCPACFTAFDHDTKFGYHPRGA